MADVGDDRSQRDAVVRIDQHLIVFVQDQVGRVEMIDAAFFFEFYAKDVDLHAPCFAFFTDEA
ncbi:MAG: hypothetical protein BWX45_01050 [Deltaproteobacteria bacterium ADurb.Bin002]|nr:MAG: hypothetical protein BWX45_01050 [Deltaproteobacteria bacterium ADurb.Bin002]